MICARCGTLHPTEDETGDYPGSAARVSRCGAEPSPKLRSYLEQENSVLHEKLRKLEIKLAAEREACAKVAERQAELLRGKVDAGTSMVLENIAALIRGRG